MRYSRMLAKTQRETAHDVRSVSHALLLRGGFIHPLGNGLFSLLPMGMRVMSALQRLMREELLPLGGQEVSVPLVNPSELWKRSGRDRLIDKDMIRFHDRYGREHVLAPTHEEAMVELVRTHLASYRDLPIFLFQFQTKFRDEEKTRSGLVRTREFVMKDGYSFHRSFTDLNNFFPKVFRAYERIFQRCGLPVRAAEAGVGYMGGDKSYEFLLACDSGDDMMISCAGCGYIANREVAVGIKECTVQAPAEIENVGTPGCLTTETLALRLGKSMSELAKTMAFMTGQGLALAVVRADYEVSVEKLARVLRTPVFRLATVEELQTAGLEPGFLSPLGLDDSVPVVIDDAAADTSNLVYGSNEAGMHVLNVNYGRDFETEYVADIAQIGRMERCRHCGGTLSETRAIEVGNLFRLGDHYSRTMELFFLDDDGSKVYPHMGAYGIGLGRLMSAVVEANHDEHGIRWPAELAPYRFYLMGVGRAAGVRNAAETLCEALGEEVLYDDRDESAGVKFRDADLLGIPFRVLVSPDTLKTGTVEIRERHSGLSRQVPGEGILEYAAAFGAQG